MYITYYILLWCGNRTQRHLVQKSGPRTTWLTVFSYDLSICNFILGPYKYRESIAKHYDPCIISLLLPQLSHMHLIFEESWHFFRHKWSGHVCLSSYFLPQPRRTRVPSFFFLPCLHSFHMPDPAEHAFLIFTPTLPFGLTYTLPYFEKLSLLCQSRRYSSNLMILTALVLVSHFFFCR